MPGLPYLFDENTLALFSSPKVAHDFLKQKGVIVYPSECMSCGGRLSLIKQGKLVRCTSNKCRKAVSTLKNSFFAGSKLQLNEILSLAYFWLLNLGCKQLEEITRLSHSSYGSYILQIF
jgi:DNA-directed RNA polymerase subunit RPC12/RpoP